MRRLLPALFASALLAGCGSPPVEPAQAPAGKPGDRYAGANYPDKPASGNAGAPSSAGR